jgi:hypothetical protein
MSLTLAEETRDSGTALGVMHLDSVFKHLLTRWTEDASERQMP